MTNTQALLERAISIVSKLNWINILASEAKQRLGSNLSNDEIDVMHQLIQDLANALKEREWLPISEAPKDGKAVIICYKNGNQDVAFLDYLTDMCWCYSHSGEPIDYEQSMITHFQHLPTPPKTNNNE